jgi:preprotein translocase subunit YajC
MNEKDNLLPITLEDAVITVSKSTSRKYLLWNIILGLSVLVSILGIVWMFYIKPMANRKIIESLKINNKIAIEGIVGIVRKIDEETFTLDIGNNTNIVIIKSHVNNIKFVNEIKK